jgi:transcription elongation factor GreA
VSAHAWHYLYLSGLCKARGFFPYPGNLEWFSYQEAGILSAVNSTPILIAWRSKKMENHNDELLLTKDGLAKLENELAHLRTVKRKEIAARIKEAISFGDITDNSEYEDAKNEQAFIEGRIITLEKLLRRARLLDKGEIDDSHVSLGSKVTIKDVDKNQDYEYTIVSTAEADPTDKKISNESPVGKAIIGLSVGDQVEVKVPAGTFNYKIEAVS